MSSSGPSAVSGQVNEETSRPIIRAGSFAQEEFLYILQVDDDVALLRVSKMILESENKFIIDTVASVDEAFKKLKTHPYDAIISDYEMPLKNGLDFLKELREQKSEVPFILFTGKGREEVVVKALNLGVDCYINKHGSPESVYCELADALNKTVERKKSKKALAESELKYRTVVEKSLQGILITQTSPLQLVFANSAMGNILGYSTDELKSLSPLGVAGLIYDEDKAVFFSRLEKRIRGEPSDASLEFRAVRKNGSIVWLEAFASRIEYMGQPAVQGMFLDIDERKKGNEILRESETRYRELANSLPDIVFESDMNGKLVFVNERALEIAGICHADLKKGLNILQFLVPEDREKAMKSIQRLLAGGSYVPAEYVFLRKDGTTFPALITTTLRVSKNKVTGLRGLVIDITERKKAEETVRKSERTYRELTNALPEIVFETDLTGKITFFSQRALEISGFSKEELEKGLNLLSFVVPEDRERAMENMKKSMTGEDHGTSNGASEYTLLRKNGTTYPALVRTNPIISENKVTGLGGLVIDLTERKKAEDALRQERKKLESVTTSINAGLVLISKDYHVLWENEFIRRYKGDVNGKLCYTALNTLDAPCSDCGVAKIFAGKTMFDTHEYFSTALDGKEYWVEIIASPIKDENGKVIAASELAVDITKRKLMEQELQASDAKFRAINESVIDAIFLFDEEDRISYWNPAAERIFGYSENEIIGKKLNATIVPPRLRNDPYDFTQKLATSENKNIAGKILELPAIRKDGTEFPLEFSITSLQLMGKQHFVAIARDITERKKAETDQKNAHARMEIANEKLRVVGGLTRHDVGNKLMAIKSNAYLLKKRIVDNPELTKYLQGINSALDGADKIIEFSRAYEKIGSEQLANINVECCFNEAAALLPELNGKKLTNECHGLTVLADSLLRQLFYNLMDNSLKHGEKVTKLRLHYRKEKNQIELLYEDNGVGISEANKPKLFEKGFSTGNGSGLGLLLIRKIVEVYGWTITETGKPGKGARFCITIPKDNQKENYQIS